MGGMLVVGLPEGVIFLLCFFAGALAGVLTSLMHNHLRVPPLLAGILTMTMLWSINIRIMGNRPNLPLLRYETSVNIVRDQALFLNGEFSLFLFFLLVVFVLKFLLDILFRTDFGHVMMAMGANPQMVISQGINPGMLKLLGLSLSNGLVAFSGAFMAQYLGFSDVGLGTGIIVSGLASVMLGEFLFKSRRFAVQTFFVLLGSVFYRAILYFGRYYGYYINLQSSDLRLITGLLVVCALIVPAIRKKRSGRDIHLHSGI